MSRPPLSSARFGTFGTFGTGAGLAIAGLWLAYASTELPAHGLAIDSSTLFFAGDRTLFWLEHPGHPEALAFLRPQNLPGFHSDFSPYFPEFADPLHYPVFPSLVASATAQLVAPLGVPNVPGHHLGLVLLHALALYCFTRLAVRLLGRSAGLFAALTLLTFPEAVGLAFNNAKDWPCTDFYACALLAGAEGLIWRRAGAVRNAGLFAGLALSCKINGAFALASLGLLGLWALWHRSASRGRLDLSALWDVATLGTLAFAVFFLGWPYLYSGPPAGWAGHVVEYVRFFANYGHSPREGWTDYPLRPLLYATPLPVLLAAAIGGRQTASDLAGSGNRERQAFAGFLLFWLTLPLLRAALPHSNFYDGNRHFLEYVPALCLLAGLGLEVAFARLLAWTSVRWPAARAAQGAAAPLEVRLTQHPVTLAAAALCGLLWLLPIARYRPFEASYFNALVGGLGGAQAGALYAMPDPHDRRVRGTEGDYWYGAIGDGLPRLAALLERTPDQGFFLCGPAVPQALGQWPAGGQRLRQRLSDSDLLYLAPREIFCGTKLIRSEETLRPLLYRAERGGGLIYEILGPVDGNPHPSVTVPSAYEADPQNSGTLPGR